MSVSVHRYQALDVLVLLQCVVVSCSVLQCVVVCFEGVSVSVSRYQVPTNSSHTYTYTHINTHTERGDPT